MGLARQVRDATAGDAAACAQIYAPYVLDTAYTFELEPPDEAEMARRIAGAVASHAWLVLEQVGRVVGYAYGGPHRVRAAYQWSCEVSVYLEVGLRRTGAGRLLYAALLERLRGRGYQTAFAGHTLPNEPSLALHAALGFEPVGVFRRVGFKHGRWHDTSWHQVDLGEHPSDPRPPT